MFTMNVNYICYFIKALIINHTSQRAILPVNMDKYTKIYNPTLLKSNLAELDGFGASTSIRLRIISI